MKYNLDNSTKQLVLVAFSVLLTFSLILIGISIYKVTHISNEDTKNNIYSLIMYFNLPLTFIITFAFFYYLYTRNNTNYEKITDANRISVVKRKFLDDILNELKLSVDPKLKKQLENGEIDEANELIVEKIDALNKLIETVNGDNTKSLRGTEISSVSEFYESTSFRIKKEIQRINSISNLNLLLGISTSIIAISVLSFTLLNHVIKMEELIPRVSLSFLIEALAFFFFNQYKKQQENIKYWNNEKTNLDLKIFALSIAIDDSEIGTADYMRNLISGLVNSERNAFSNLNNDEKEDSKVGAKEKEVVDFKKLTEEIISKVKDIQSLR